MLTTTFSLRITVGCHMANMRTVQTDVYPLPPENRAGGRVWALVVRLVFSDVRCEVGRCL